MSKVRSKKLSLEKTFKVIDRDLTHHFSVGSTAQMVMKCLENKVSPELLVILNTMLLGFNDDMQLEIADDLLDFAYSQMVHTTGCLSADAVLKGCYSLIADELGVGISIN